MNPTTFGKFGQALCVFALLFQLAPVRADEDKATSLAKQHYQAGLDAYAAKDYELAVRELKAAYLIKRMPMLLRNIAATYRKLGDTQEAILFYKQYLEEAPNAPDRDAIKRAVAEFEMSMPPPETGGGGMDTAPAKPKPKLSPTEVGGDLEEEEAPKVPYAHTTIDAAPPDQPIDVKVTAPKERVEAIVYYRSGGAADFVAVPMLRRRGTLIGRIPALAVTGTSLQYFVESKLNGKITNTIGDRISPNVILIDATAAPMFDKEAPAPVATPTGPVLRKLDDEDAPLAARLAGQPRRTTTVPGVSQGGKHGALFWSGIGLLGLGGVSLIVGIVGDVQAKRYSDVVAFDSRNPDDQGKRIAYFDPTYPPTDADYAQRGKQWNAVGISFTVIGALSAATGAALLTSDFLLQKPESKRTAARDWFLVPSVTPQTAGVAGGFKF